MREKILSEFKQCSYIVILAIGWLSLLAIILDIASGPAYAHNITFGGLLFAFFAAFLVRPTLTRDELGFCDLKLDSIKQFAHTVFIEFAMAWAAGLMILIFAWDAIS